MVLHKLPPVEVQGSWQCPAMCSRRRRETSCHVLTTDTWHRLLLHRDRSVGATLGQTLKCQWSLRDGLLCAVCYSCVLNTQNWEWSSWCRSVCCLCIFNLPCICPLDIRILSIPTYLTSISLSMSIMVAYTYQWIRIYLNIAVFYCVNPFSLIISVPTFQKNLPRGSSIYLPVSIMSVYMYMYVCVYIYIYIFMRLFCCTYLFLCYDPILPVECTPMYACVPAASQLFMTSVCLSVCLSQGGRHDKNHNAFRSYVSPKLERTFS